MLSTPYPNMQIAGFKTCADWQLFSAKLVPGGDVTIWRDAAKEYFHERLFSRYLDPIKVLQDNGTYTGEGFSIAAIQCTLIEFLESTVQGISYRYQRGTTTLGPYEYSNSRNLFVSFLNGRKPFSNDFNNKHKQLAQDFYEGVRCGLLHEARTKGGWTIWADGPVNTVIQPTKKIIYRNNFQIALLEFTDWYEKALVSDVALQSAFIRKFDSLCA